MSQKKKIVKQQGHFCSRFARLLLKTDDQVKGQTSSTFVDRQQNLYESRRRTEAQTDEADRVFSPPLFRVAALPLNLLLVYDLPIKDDESSESAAAPSPQQPRRARGSK